MFSLRPYQEEAQAAIHKEWNEGRKRTLLVLPTGCGKTLVFSNVAKDVVDAGGRVLILAHRGELLEQAQDKLLKATGLGSAVEKAEQSCIGSWFNVVVGSVQTLYREKRLKQFDSDYFDAIIVDEAHHVLSDTYQTILKHFSGANVLGVTATPDRGDRRSLGAFFDSVAYEYTLPRAIKEGYLCPIMAQTIPLKIDLKGVKQSAGDYSAGDLGDHIEPYLEAVADEMLNNGIMERKTVVFLPLIQTSQKFRDILQAKGINALEVNGESQDREEVLAAFDRAGKGTVLCNSMLLTEGWDCPSVDCVIVLRPTKVRSLYCQMVGRGTRLSPETGKENLLLLDFLWQTEKHELCRPAHLIATSEDVAAAMTKKSEEAGAQMELEELLESSESEVMAQREESLAKQLKEMRTRKRKLVDPLQFEMSIQDKDLSNYVPNFGWEMAPASKKQLEALEKAGIYPDSVECAGKANLLLDRIAKRRAEGLTTPKQIRFLEQKGFLHVGEWSFEDANKMIGRISANGWRVPKSVEPSKYAPQTYNPDIRRF